jgi:hypothetical protein
MCTTALFNAVLGHCVESRDSRGFFEHGRDTLGDTVAEWFPFVGRAQRVHDGIERRKGCRPGSSALQKGTDCGVAGAFFETVEEVLPDIAGGKTAVYSELYFGASSRDSAGPKVHERRCPGRSIGAVAGEFTFDSRESFVPDIVDERGGGFIGQQSLSGRFRPVIPCKSCEPFLKEAEIAAGLGAALQGDLDVGRRDIGVVERLFAESAQGLRTCSTSATGLAFKSQKKIA